jgi:hypothetical protein
MAGEYYDWLEDKVYSRRQSEFNKTQLREIKLNSSDHLVFISYMNVKWTECLVSGISNGYLPEVGRASVKKTRPVIVQSIFQTSSLGI